MTSLLIKNRHCITHTCCLRHIVYRLLASNVQDKATENITKSSNVVNKNDNVSTKPLLPDGKKPIWYYHNKGIRARKLNQLIRESQEDAKTESEEKLHVKRLLGVLTEMGVTVKEVTNIFFNKPKILQLSKANLQKRLLEFIKIGWPKDTVKDMIIDCPGLLLLDVKEMSIQKRLNLLQELPLFPRLSQDRCIYLVQKCPRLLYLTKKSTMREKIRLFEQIELHQQQIFELFMKHPAILTYKLETIRDKINFVLKEMNGRPALIVKFPRLLTSSLKRMKERYAFLKHEHYLNERSHISENKLRSIILTTDSDFVYRVTNTKMKDFRQFQIDFANGKYDDGLDTEFENADDLTDDDENDESNDKDHIDNSNKENLDNFNGDSYVDENINNLIFDSEFLDEPIPVKTKSKHKFLKPIRRQVK